MSDIILKNVSKTFGDKTVFDGLSLTVPQGSRLCVMGSSGRGKTTLLHLLLGIISPDSGEILGIPDRLSAVFQEDRLFCHLSAVQNLQSVADKSVSESDIYDMLARLGLSGEENTPVSSMSGGMRRRVAIARALLHDSQLLILDEPFKGLDDATRDQAIRTINDFSQNKTLIIASHDVTDAEKLGADVIDLNKI